MVLEKLFFFEFFSELSIAIQWSEKIIQNQKIFRKIDEIFFENCFFVESFQNG